MLILWSYLEEESSEEKLPIVAKQPAPPTHPYQDTYIAVDGLVVVPGLLPHEASEISIRKSLVN